MEAQVDVLEGKRKTLARFRDSLVELRRGVRRARWPRGGRVRRVRRGPGAVAATAGRGRRRRPAPPMSRIVLDAQEDLRREIARAMHDGPAQSLTNIVLQAQIVERLLGRDPAAPAASCACSCRWSSRRSTRRRRSSSTSGRWSSTTSASCRRSGAPRANAAGGRACRSSSTRSAGSADRGRAREQPLPDHRRGPGGVSAGRPDRVVVRLDWSEERSRPRSPPTATRPARWPRPTRRWPMSARRRRHGQGPAAGPRIDDGRSA